MKITMIVEEQTERAFLPCLRSVDENRRCMCVYRMLSVGEVNYGLHWGKLPCLIFDSEESQPKTSFISSRSMATKLVASTYEKSWSLYLRRSCRAFVSVRAST